MRFLVNISRVHQINALERQHFSRQLVGVKSEKRPSQNLAEITSYSSVTKMISHKKAGKLSKVLSLEQ